MSTTLIYSIDGFIKFLKEMEQKGFKKIAISIGGCYEAYSPSKKKPYYRLKFDMSQDVFKEESVAMFMYLKNVDFCGLLVHEDVEDHLKEFDKKEVSHGRKDR